MAADARCREAVPGLTEAFLARREPDAADVRHAAGCADCTRVRHELATLARVLDESPPEGALSDARAAEVLRAASAELAATPARPAAAIAPGFGRELGRLLAYAAIPVPLLALWYLALLRYGGALLSEWLPGFLVTSIGVAFGVGAASWLGLVYASLPVVAHRRALRRNEVTA